MKSTAWIAVLAFSSLAVACEKPETEEMDDAPTAEEIAAVRSAIEAANAVTVAALNAADVPKMLSNYTDDAILMLPNAPPMRGHAGIDAGIKAMLETVTLSNVSVTIEDVMLSGDMAFETGSTEMTMTPKGGKPVVDKGKYLVVWKRQADGTWKIVRDSNSSNLPAM